jgi:hypothetical protein
MAIGRAPAAILFPPLSSFSSSHSTLLKSKSSCPFTWRGVNPSNGRLLARMTFGAHFIVGWGNCLLQSFMVVSSSKENGGARPPADWYVFTWANCEKFAELATLNHDPVRQGLG